MTFSLIRGRAENAKVPKALAYYSRLEREARRILYLSPYKPEHLYTVVASHSGLRAMEAALAARGRQFQPGGDTATIALAEMGVPDAQITFSLRLDDEEYAIKRRALAAHATQMFSDSELAALPEAIIRPWLGVEHYVRLALAMPLHAGADIDPVARLSAA